jgi:bifunctional enzyme CysN/CysC
LWFTGLSGAGKSTIADLLEQSLHQQNHHTIVLDGDNVRHGLNRDLGFTDEDRVDPLHKQVLKLLIPIDSRLICTTDLSLARLGGVAGGASLPEFKVG